MHTVIGSRATGWPTERALTFLQNTWQLTDDLNTRSLRMEAKGVTPMPPPTSTDTSNLCHSWWPSPNGPSRYSCREGSGFQFSSATTIALKPEVGGQERRVDLRSEGKRGLWHYPEQPVSGQRGTVGSLVLQGQSLLRGRGSAWHVWPGSGYLRVSGTAVRWG